MTGCFGNLSDAFWGICSRGCESRDRIGGIEPKKSQIPRNLGSWSVAGLSSHLPKFLPLRGDPHPSAAVQDEFPQALCCIRLSHDRTVVKEMKRMNRGIIKRRVNM